jgi:hypothetical protein
MRGGYTGGNARSRGAGDWEKGRGDLMSNWKLHGPTEGNVFLTYRCGLIAGQRVALRKDMAVNDHCGNATGEVFPKGEVWVVLPGLHSDPVLWFRQADGKRHTWDDDAESVHDWFEVGDNSEQPAAILPEQ